MNIYEINFMTFLVMGTISYWFLSLTTLKQTPLKLETSTSKLRSFCIEGK